MQPHLNGTFHYLPVSLTRYTCILCMCSHAFHFGQPHYYACSPTRMFLHASKQRNLGGLNNQKGDSLQTRYNSPSQTENFLQMSLSKHIIMTFTVQLEIFAISLPALIDENFSAIVFFLSSCVKVAQHGDLYHIGKNFIPQGYYNTKEAGFSENLSHENVQLYTTSLYSHR